MAVVTSKKKKPAGAKEPQGSRIDEQLMPPGKYEVTPEHTFDVEIHLSNKDGRWIVVKGPGKNVDTHKLVFRMWTYEEMIDIKKRVTVFDNTKRIHTIDQDHMNQLKVQKFLMSWTFDRDNPRLKLHRVQGVLTDESWHWFVQLQTNIITYILEKMNEILEYNG